MVLIFLMDITLRQVRYFIATAESGQITKAALLCNVTQSSVTIAIKGLEQQLGYKLFVRESKGMHLTTLGERFLRHCHSIVRTVEDATEAVPEEPSEISGVVKVGVTDTISGYFLPPIWRKLRRDYPEITLEILEVSRQDLEAGLLDDKFDVAIMLTSNIRHRDPFHYEELIASPRRLWVSSRNSLAEKELVSIHDLAEEDYILLTMDEHETTMRNVWQQHGFTPNITFRSHTMEALRSMVANDMGVAILSDMVYRSWSLEGRPIVKKDLIEEIPSMNTGMTWRRGKKLSNAATTFLSFLRSDVLSGRD